jgi:3D (Asp-Asp-Asp) domain-containing protein
MQKFQMEGTGLLKSGELVNIGLNDKVFAVVDQKKHPYGIGSDDNSIYPFTSVASNDLKLGTKLYVKAIDGLLMPTGQTHNGCLRVDDSGDSFSGCQLDFFVLGKYKLKITFLAIQQLIFGW